MSMVFVFLLTALTAYTGAQTTEIYLSPIPSTKPMTVADVIKLAKAGVSDDIIVEQIRKKGQAFDLSTDQILQLKAAHVSDRVVEVMLDPDNGSAQSPPVKSAAAAAPVGAAPPQLQGKRTGPTDPALPTEIGVYAKDKNNWTEVLPEVVNWKTGGVAKSVATVGIVKGDVNGHVNGASSRNHFASPVEFLIVVPEGDAITEYQLLRLHQHGDNREFRTVTGGVLHVSGGATRDLVPFEGTKVATRTYKVSFSDSSGEYGFLPPGAFISTNAASIGKIYSFRILE